MYVKGVFLISLNVSIGVGFNNSLVKMFVEVNVCIRIVYCISVHLGNMHQQLFFHFTSNL